MSPIAVTVHNAENLDHRIAPDRYGDIAITVANPLAGCQPHLNFRPGLGCGFSFEGFQVRFGERLYGLLKPAVSLQQLLTKGG